MQWKQWNIKNFGIKTVKCKENAAFLHFSDSTWIVFIFHLHYFLCVLCIDCNTDTFAVFNVFTVNLTVLN